MADDSPVVPLSKRSGTFYIPSKDTKQAYTVAERMRIYNVKGAGPSERKNQPGEHDQVETHTPIMYRGSVDAAATERVVGLESRAGLSSRSGVTHEAVAPAQAHVQRQVAEHTDKPLSEGKQVVRDAVEKIKAKKAELTDLKAKMDEERKNSEPLIKNADEVLRKIFTAKTPEEEAVARSEFDRVDAELEKHAEVQKAVNKAYFDRLEEVDNDIKELIYSKIPGKVLRPDYELNPEANIAQLQDGVEFVNKIFDNKVMAGGVYRDNIQMGIKWEPNGTRASANHTDIRVPTGTDADTVVHEAGHVIENVIPSVRRAARDFYAKRTAGEQPIRLKDLDKDAVRNYEDHEVTKLDHFIEPYMGKLYSNGSTEVVSMGLQMMYRSPQKLLDQDPEYFEFMVNIMRGNND